MATRRRALLVASLLIALVTSFVVFDFHAMESQTEADSSVGTSRTNDATAPVTGTMHLLVLGDGPVADRLEDELASELTSTWASIQGVNESVESVSGPVLVVLVTSTDVNYNPVTPSAQVRADFGFVGSGNVTLAETFATGEGPVVLSKEIPYAVRGSVTITDHSRGVVSVPAYAAHVTRRLAENIGTELTSAPGMPEAS